MKRFTEISTMKNYVIVEADVVNLCAQYPSPFEPTYVRVDAQYSEWYQKRFCIEIVCKIHVLPVQHALQGYPESDSLWAHPIEGHLQDLEFISATHKTGL